MNLSSLNFSLESASRAKLLSPRPAELITLPSYMDCHEHSYTQIVIGLKGLVEFEVSGVANVVGTGQGCVVTASTDHAFGSLAHQSDILVLNLPYPAEDDSLILEKINELSKMDIYFQLDSSIQKLIDMLVQEIRSSPNDLLLSRACSDTVLALLLHHISAFDVHRRESRFDLEVVDRYIEQHLSRRISIAQLAGSVYLGESQFHQLFKEQVGVTPHQYVLKKRVDLAKTLIEQGRFSLGQVAELTGFSNQSTFTHTFSRLQGVSPSQYRKRFYR
ncbi:MULTISPECIES: AraC family transcriptional regulator [unclassified Vibrio]|uniref:AraC family transcriptional regulator n=1 Tax=unclassified Vibrio TaxID=2614977 RepID=UPI0014823677|nr:MULTISPECIES: AraC family transcriptional regulator [unclassified Vibrio]NNN44843.1 helix-turn-helix transcriptional regulator [Vibrio sp. 1-1(7)]NNN72216.1 helix-turn-helix transcriptional regulator [Vibrio sp. 12-2(3-a)]